MPRVGLAQLREGLEGLRRLGAELRLPYYFTLLAETFGRAGLVGEALASLSTGFAFASKNGEEWAVAELHRVQGNLLAAEGKLEAARASFRRGLEAARRSRFAGVRAKIVDSRGRNGCNRLHRTLLERRAGQSRQSPARQTNRAPAIRRTAMSLQQAITEFRGQFRGAVHRA